MGIGVAEAIDELRVLSENDHRAQPTEPRPILSRRRILGGRCSDVPNRTVAFGLKF